MCTPGFIYLKLIHINVSIKGDEKLMRVYVIMMMFILLFHGMPYLNTFSTGVGNYRTNIMEKKIIIENNCSSGNIEKETSIDFSNSVAYSHWSILCGNPKHSGLSNFNVSDNPGKIRNIRDKPDCTFSEQPLVGPDNDFTIMSQINHNSLKILAKPVKIKDVETGSNLIVNDFDNNGYPDIIYSYFGKTNRTQYSNSTNWTTSMINTIGTIVQVANVTDDEYLDFIHTMRINGSSFIAISEGDKNGSLIKSNYYNILSGINDMNIEDVNADGDNDLIFSVDGNHIQIYENLGNGSFNVDWDKGIIDKLKDPFLPNLWNDDLDSGDINNDGYVDICTAMRMGGGYPSSYSTHYIWLSQGDGTGSITRTGFQHLKKQKKLTWLILITMATLISAF